MKYRQYFLIYIFLICCFVLVILTNDGTFNHFGNSNQLPNGAENSLKNADEVVESYFKNAEYFLLDNSLPVINLKAESLTLSSSDSKVLGINPHGIVYRESGDSPIQFNAKNSKVYFEKKEIHLDNEVHVNADNVELTSDNMKIDISKNELYARGRVKTELQSKDDNEQILINANEAVYKSRERFFEYRNSVYGTLKRKKKYEESVSFTTDFLNFDGINNTAELKGNVHLMRDNFDVFANFGNIFLENYNKKLKYYSFSDDVRLVEKVNSEGRHFTRKAFSEKLEGVMSERKIILTGLPKVFQEKDVIKGNVIIIRENVETVEVDDANTNIILKE